MVQKALGKEAVNQGANLASILDGYTAKEGHHLNINILNSDTLLDAMGQSEEYP